jgi:hypothetical protein
MEEMDREMDRERWTERERETERDGCNIYLGQALHVKK